jgi:FkbM family methyltransferase
MLADKPRPCALVGRCVSGMKRDTDIVVNVLKQLDPAPVLVDIGASAEPPAIWNPIAQQSTYVGFDPDDREFGDRHDPHYRRLVHVSGAVTANSSGKAPFFFTRSPFCSSTLKPSAAALSDYAFAPLFDVVRSAPVRTVTIDETLAQHGIETIDWLKIDSQGTDLRVYTSITAARRPRVLALDVEPGLIDAYEGEDLFVDAHRELLREGFWLSRLDVVGNVRMKPASLAELSRCDPCITLDSIRASSRHAPVCCEARYLRTVEALAAAGLHRREHLLLAVFAALDQQWAFAFEAVTASERAFGGDRATAALKTECVRRLRPTSASPLRAMARRFVPARLRSFLAPA